MLVWQVKMTDGRERIIDCGSCAATLIREQGAEADLVEVRDNMKVERCTE